MGLVFRENLREKFPVSFAISAQLIKAVALIWRTHDAGVSHLRTPSGLDKCLDILSKRTLSLDAPSCSNYRGTEARPKTNVLFALGDRNINDIPVVRMRPANQIPLTTPTVFEASRTIVAASSPKSSFAVPSHISKLEESATPWDAVPVRDARYPSYLSGLSHASPPNRRADRAKPCLGCQRRYGHYRCLAPIVQRWILLGLQLRFSGLVGGHSPGCC